MPSVSAGWQVESSIATLGVPLRLADEARETRSGYLDFRAGAKTKTSNAAITDAASQVALAFTAMLKNTGTKYSATGRSVISKDGKTMTTTTEGTNAEGNPMNYTMVYEKQ